MKLFGRCLTEEIINIICLYESIYFGTLLSVKLFIVDGTMSKANAKN